MSLNVDQNLCILHTKNVHEGKIWSLFLSLMYITLQRGYGIHLLFAFGENVLLLFVMKNVLVLAVTDGVLICNMNIRMWIQF